MIIIITTLPSEEMMMETMIPPQVGMRLRTLKINKRGQRSPNKKRGQRRPPKRKEKIKNEKEKNERKREKGQCYYPFTPHVFQSSTMFFIERASYAFTFISSGNFHYRTWHVYSVNGLPQMPEVFMSKQVGCTHTQFQFELSYTYSSSASVAWQSLLLALTSIDEHLHSPLISLVDVRLSPFLSSPHNPHHHILFHLQCYVHGSRSCIA